MGLQLRLAEPLLNDLPCASEELLSAVWQAEIGNPASILSWIDRSVAVTAPLYARSRHGVDILPSTRACGKGLYGRTPRQLLATKDLVDCNSHQPFDEAFEVALKDAP